MWSITRCISMLCTAIRASTTKDVPNVLCSGQSSHIYHSGAQLLACWRRVVKTVSDFITALKHSREFWTWQSALSFYICLWCCAASCHWVTKQYVTVQYNDSAFPQGHQVWEATTISTQRGGRSSCQSSHTEQWTVNSVSFLVWIRFQQKCREFWNHGQGSWRFTL